MRRRSRIGLRILALLVALMSTVVVTAVLVLNSGWFHGKVRQRIVMEMERVTGGTATIGDYVLNWRLLTVQFNDLYLHGTEPPNVPPLLYAKSIQVGLKVVSFLKKDVDVESVVVSEPKVNVIVAADGSTNIPSPKVKRTGKTGLEPLLDLKIGAFALENGTMLFGVQRSWIDAKGENLRARFSYDATGPRYKGQVSIQPLLVNSRQFAPAKMDVFLILGLEKNRIEVSNAKFDMAHSQLEASGSIEDLASPKAEFHFTAHLGVGQLAQLLKVRFARQGTVDLTGTASYKSSTDYLVQASLDASDIDVQQDGIRVSNVRAASKLRFDPRGLEFDDIALNALGGHFTGRAGFPNLERFVVDGTVRGIDIQRALQTVAPRLPLAGKGAWSGAARGRVHVEGRMTGRQVVVATNLSIAPGASGIPVEGSIDARYDGATGILSLGKSYLSMPGGHVNVSGALGTELHVAAVATNFADLLPAINAFSTQPVNSLPIQLKNGKATFDGMVTGKLTSPRIAGAASLTNFVYSGIDFDRFAGQLILDQSSVRIENGTLARGAAQAQVTAAAGLEGWKIAPASPIATTAVLRGAEIAELLSLAGQKQIPIRGALAVSATISGTVENPRASAEVTATKGVAYDEPFDKLQANVEYSPANIAIRQAVLTMGPAQIAASGSFEPTRPFSGAPEIRSGRAQFKVASNDMAIQQFQTMKRLRPDISGVVRTKFEGSAAIDGGALLTSLSGDAAARDLIMNGRPIGNIKAAAQTEAQVLRVKLDSNFLDSNLAASGEWRLVPGYPGKASAQFSRISLGTARDWFVKPGERSVLNFDGSAEGTISIEGPALDPQAWKAAARLSKLEVFPAERGGERGVSPRFVLRNEGPVVATLEKSTINLTSAHLTGPSTDVTIKGTAMLGPKGTMDLRVNGAVNLAVLQTFETDIETAGAMTINATVRGTPSQPLINGQLDLKRAALHFVEINTGLSDANGIVLFSGSQATLQDFSGLMGGGRVALTGVIGYAGGELSYRVDAAAKDVRIRYPEGASTSANADLSLRGTTLRSTLSGAVTILRTGFNPRTDFSSILGKASEPVKTPSTRIGPLSGMQFDVRVDTAPDISFESSLAQDIQVEGNLRLQGTPYNPVLLGRLNITQGEINFFGTRYTVNQGSITFANPVKLEPVLNVDLETRVQGIDVVLTISGPINKLNVTPRSDPPMEFSDVLALLATGSTRLADPALASRQNAPASSFTQLGASALIGQVVANPVSSRLQRFFGVSRLKIDPQLTGVENNPQARLTLEQQVTKNLTFTYITNLATSNQQIVRVEWALNKNFSAIAVRDENGLFGLDFLYKKRFK